MKIYNTLPSDWKDLEKKVSQVLNEAGFITEVEKTITTVRGKVNIDVYAEDKENRPHSIYLCECKYWEKDIEQSIVHSFRTVVGDYGANYGLLIAKNGFQIGARETVKNTNIKLLSWVEFLELFEDRWLRNKIECIHTLCEPLSDYTDILPSDFIDTEYKKLSQEKKELFKVAFSKYMGIAFYCSNYLLKDFSTGKINKDNLNSRIEQAQKELIKYTINCYDDYFRTLKTECENGISFFDGLFGKPLRYDSYPRS